MTSIYRYTAGPRLLHLYKHGSFQGRNYEENGLEQFSSRTISCLKAGFWACYYLSPVLMIFLYRRGLITSMDGPPYLAKVVAVTMSVYYLAHITRGLGRINNDIYRKFLADLKVRETNPNSQVYRQYDYDFNHWPVDFTRKKPTSHPVKPPPVNVQAGIFTKCLSYFASISFARWLIYPGSTMLINAAVEPALIDGRKKLIESLNGTRYKLETCDGNYIDTMFVDRRADGSENGNILVITSEGNAAFYEAGCNEAPLARGYSVLGWNHPGFGSSTGIPYPEQEHNAMDCVVQFALEKLGFLEEQIVFFSWSIGGFSSSWGAANYPGCKALILDATFDDVLPLAKSRMPAVLEPMTGYAIRRYFDLDIARWANQYKGPIKLIRRTRDEMISVDPADIRTNRGNFLLIKILQYRYPQIMNEEATQLLTRYLSFTERRKDDFKTQLNFDKAQCDIEIHRLYSESPSYPMTSGDDVSQELKGKLAVYLADKYMVDVVTTHCTPLPNNLFTMPWSLDMA